MRYQFKSEPGYLCMEVFGRDSEQDMVASYDAILAESKKLSQLRLLMVCDDDHPVPVAGLFDMVSRLTRANFGKRKLAVVYKDPVTFKAHQFGETAANNRGLNIHLFLDRDRAIAWLVDAASAGPVAREAPIDGGRKPNAY